MSFGHALYYPHINLTNKNWLKYALLYWDKISRIVPPGVYPEDSEEVIRIRSEFNFIEDHAPNSSSVSRASEEFFHWLSYRSAWDFRDRFDPLTEELMHRRSQRQAPTRFRRVFGVMNAMVRTRSAYIHVVKLEHTLKEFLIASGMAVPGENEWEDWLRVDSEIGLLYMSYLARTISDDTGRPVITDAPEAFSTSDVLNNAITGHSASDLPHRLGNLLIATYGPKDMNQVTFEQVLAFREKHDDDRIAFFDHINTLCRALPEVSSAEQFRDALNHYEKSQEKAVEDLRKQFIDVRIEPVLRFLGISALTSWIGLSEYVPDAYRSLVFASGTLLGVADALHERRKAKKALSENPLSYLLSLQPGIDAKSMLEKLGQTNRNLW